MTTKLLQNIIHYPTMFLMVLTIVTPVNPAFGNETKKTKLVDSVPFEGGKEGYKVYRCPTLAVSNKGTVLAFC
ncbi:MAG: hypothetical protein ACO3GX_17185, partial [Gemmataceae bacterium]